MKYLQYFIDYMKAALVKKLTVPAWVFVAMVIVYMLPRPF